MSNGKVKHRKQNKRLAARIEAWEKLDTGKDEKNRVSKFNGLAFRKPGSNRK